MADIHIGQAKVCTGKEVQPKLGGLEGDLSVSHKGRKAGSGKVSS